MQKEEQTTLESIIQLSDEPIAQLSTVIGSFNENIELRKNMPFFVKPLLKNDLPSFSRLDEEEMLDLLNNMMKNFKKIKSAASSIKINRPMEKPTSSYDLGNFLKLRSRKQHIKKTNNVLVNKSTLNLPTIEEKTSEKETKFCPECGHKCQGQDGLIEHIEQSHYNQKEEIMKLVELYGI